MISTSSKELYLELIEPFEDYIKNKKDLIIVPHGSLLSLPFEILVSKVPENKNINTDNWLIKNHNIIYYPSISSFYSMKNLKKIKLKITLLVLVILVYPKIIKSLVF